MDIQRVFSEYKAVPYMYLYFSKIEDKCSQAMKEAAKKAFENNPYHYELMKTISRANLRKRKVLTKCTEYTFLNFNSGRM